MGGVISATHTEEIQTGLPGFGHSVHSTGSSIDQSEPIYRSLELPPDFAYSWEEAFAETLNQHGISWQYKPRTFAVEWDNEGNFVDSFTPDFYLPLIDLYVELIGPNRSEASG